jgi:hypothetical protein
MTASLTSRLARAEDELREQQKVAAATRSPWDILDTISEDEFERIIRGEVPRPTPSPCPPGADPAVWELDVKNFEAAIDVLSGRPIPDGLSPEIRAVLERTQQKIRSEALLSNSASASTKTSQFSDSSDPSRPRSQSDSPDLDFIEDLR